MSLLCAWDSPGKNTGTDCHALLQGILPTQRSNPSLLHLLHCRQILYSWAIRGSPLPWLLSHFSIIWPKGNAMQSMDCSLPGSSVHGILHKKNTVWVAMLSSRGSSQPRDRTQVSCISCIAGWFFMAEPPGKPPLYVIDAQKILVERMNTTLTMNVKAIPF